MLRLEMITKYCANEIPAQSAATEAGDGQAFPASFFIAALIGDAASS